MSRYWVMRVDHGEARDFLWAELQEGRLRQGWGYREDQNLETIANLKAKGKWLTKHQQDTWRGNRRMLAAEPDSIQKGDLILVPHLPHDRRWSLVRVTGPYSFAIAAGRSDYGHILPVELLSRHRPINPHEPAVAASLRQTAKARQRLWNIDDLGADVERILRELEKGGPPPEPVEDRLGVVLGALEFAGWKELQFHFQAAEFERPCVRLLEALYGKGNVEHTGGRDENGADAICSYQDPLGVPHRVAVQIKMWDWDAAWSRPLAQIEKAYESYEGITSGVILTTAEKATLAFEEEQRKLERKLRIPIKLVLRQELLRLFLAHLPALVGADVDPPERPVHEPSFEGTDGEDGRQRSIRRPTFAALFPRFMVTGPTESTKVTGLAWELGKACGMKLSRTYQLPSTPDGAHQVVFVVKGAVTPQQRGALVEALRGRAGGMTVEVGLHPHIEVDLEGEPASAFQALVAKFSV